MFQLEADRPEFLCVLNPRSVDHPDRTGGSLSANHEEGRPAWLVEGRIDKVTLLPGPEKSDNNSALSCMDDCHLPTVVPNCIHYAI